MIRINIGDIFGTYLVESRNYEKKAIATYWNCSCIYCKEKKVIRGDSLRNKPTCKCQNGIDKIGKIYETWKIIEKTEKRNSGNNIIYKCQCINCNFIDYIPSNQLRDNNVKKCSNCYTKKTTLIDMTGQIYGNLKILKRDLSKDKIGHEQDAYWICECLKCGSIKSIRGIDIRQGKVISCGCIKSKGEEKIASLLKENNINFCREYTFNDLYFNNINNKLRFDFAIFENNKLKYLIEYDGEQHFFEGIRESGWNNKDNYLLTKQRDELKNQYCINNKIWLIRINYLEEITIEKLLGEKESEGGWYGIK